MKYLLSTVFAAAFIGASAFASPALSQETEALDNLYACVGYYSIFEMLPVDKSVRQHGDKQLSQIYKIIRTIEGRSLVSPNDLSQITKAGFQDENNPDVFVEKTRNADESCTETILKYSSVSPGDAVPMSEGPNVAMIVHNRKLVTGKATYEKQEAERAAADEEMSVKAQLCAIIYYVETENVRVQENQLNTAFFFARSYGLGERNGTSREEIYSRISQKYNETAKMRLSMEDKYFGLLNMCREHRASFPK